MREIEGLLEHEGRVAGSDAERRAAQHLVGRLREMGREADAEPTRILPNHAVTHAVHALLGVLGSILSVFMPAAGAALLLLTAISAFGDLTGSFQLVRRLTGRRASQNVVSPEDGDKPGRLVLMAHYDAARTGAIFGRRVSERIATLSDRLKRPIGLLQPLFVSLVVVLACGILRLFLGDNPIIAIVQFIPTVVLIVAVPLLLDVALSGVVPGANDNASGVATVLRLADRYGGKLDNFNLWVVFPGAHEPQAAGAREFFDRHEGDLPAANTVVLNVDEVGAGTVRYARREGPVFTSPHHPSLLELCDAITEEDEEESRFGAKAIVSRAFSDGLAARNKRIPAVSVSCRNALGYAPHHHRASDTAENIDEEALERAYGFCCALVERIDARIGHDVEGEESVLTEKENVQ